MKDFIVWDKIAKEFADNICLDAELLKDGISYSLEVKEELFELFYPIGLKDINGKTIYADSSIVEFKNIGSNYTGYFTFDLVKLCYKIIVLDIKSVRKEFIFNSNNIENIKIIDTIQENKLGLIK